MKRLFAFLLALTLIFSLSVTAFADDEVPVTPETPAAPTTGSITITNATIGHSYSLYKIFDATYSTDASGATDAISYSITKDNQFFTYLFGSDGTAVNDFFTYNPDTGAVTRKENTDNAAIIAYLAEMIQNDEDDHYSPVIDTVTAESATITFDNLPFGYYLINKGADSAVTITSNAPTVNVIDKNQIPGGDFQKLVYDEETETWVVNSSANIGDIVDFRVSFQATNYDGDHHIGYYTINDTKGEALWVEFNDINITIQVDDETVIPLTRGYYHLANQAIATEAREWEWLGDWNGITKDPDNAQYYLIHRGYDNFDIVIPWREEHDFTGTNNGFTLTYADNAISKYPSPVTVTVEYSASVEPNASIGNGQANNLWNTTDLTWTSNVTNGPDDPSTTTLYAYALGLKKVDADTEEALAGAIFELYRDQACTSPVWVIPTNIQGIYILDDLGTEVSGENRQTARSMYAAYLNDYLDGATQRNTVTAQANGKILVLGLEAGEYWLKETQAPAGYNALPGLISINVGSTNSTFFVIADPNGTVIDAQNALDGYTRHTFLASSTVVKNSKGVVLPSTGGEGTMMLITIGTVIAMAFAVLLITHKKMTIYND